MPTSAPSRNPAPLRRDDDARPVASAHAPETPTARRGSAAASAALAATISTLAVALIAVLFLWPVHSATAKDLPVVLAGPAQATQLVKGRLTADGSPFTVTEVTSRADAVDAIEDRTAYGAVVVSPGPVVDVEVLTASAASPVVAQSLATLPGRIPAQAAPGVTTRVHVTDVVPLAESDPRGAGMAMLVLPLGIGGLVVGGVVALRTTGRARKTLALLVASACAGLMWVLVLHPWFGVLTGSVWTEWGIASLAIAATAAFSAGAHALVGVAGLALASLTTLPFGFPLAGTQLPPEFLPAPWGAVGQALVPGAASTAFRLESYFPAAGLGSELAVLTAWLLAGLLALAVGRRGSAPTAGLAGRHRETPPDAA